jgi:hypothetical protein
MKHIEGDANWDSETETETEGDRQKEHEKQNDLMVGRLNDALNGCAVTKYEQRWLLRTVFLYI